MRGRIFWAHAVSERAQPTQSPAVARNADRSPFQAIVSGRGSPTSSNPDCRSWLQVALGLASEARPKAHNRWMYGVSVFEVINLTNIHEMLVSCNHKEVGQARILTRLAWRLLTRLAWRFGDENDTSNKF